MISYVLIIMMAANSGASSHGNPAVSQQVYATRESCLTAAHDVTDAVAAMPVSNDGNRPAVIAICEAQGQ